VQDAGVDAIADEREQATIEQVYRQQGGQLWRALVAFTGDRELASDAVAEAFAQLISRGDAVSDPARWVWRAGFKIAAGELDRSRRRPRTGADQSSFEAASEGSVDLMKALQALPRRQRAVLVLHYLVDLPTPEVARALGMATPTVRVHLTQGRRRLRALLEVTDA
jgi:RNA polymerase sigma factor (sigma-70 family)